MHSDKYLYNELTDIVNEINRELNITGQSNTVVAILLQAKAQALCGMTQLTSSIRR